MKTIKTIEQEAYELEMELRQAAQLPLLPTVIPSPSLTQTSPVHPIEQSGNTATYDTFKNIVYPLVRTIRNLPHIEGSAVSFRGNGGNGVLMVSIIFDVLEQHVEAFGHVLSTIFYKGGLASHWAAHDPAVDPIRFRFSTQVQSSGNDLEVSNILELWVAPDYDRSAAKHQVMLLRAILSDKRNFLTGVVPPALFPHVTKAGGLCLAAD